MNDDVNPNVYVQIYKGRNLFGQKWRFRIRGRNNETIATSEAYHNRADAEKTVGLLFPDGVEVKDK
jgi:uncharacterized protein YegP (UPF0339 family)